MDRLPETPPTTYHPRLVGPIVTLEDLETEFGICAGVMLGYGEGDLGDDGRLRWCASMLPGAGMPRFVQNRALTAGRSPFLLALGSFKRAATRGGTGQALYGFGLAACAVQTAERLLWPDQLRRPDALDDDGRFRWAHGVPLFRVWLCGQPVPFRDITGETPTFNQSHGIRVVPLIEVGSTFHASARAVPLRRVELDPPPQSDILAVANATLSAREGTLRYRLTAQRERDRRVRDEAWRRHLVRFDQPTCEDCGYTPSTDKRVPRGRWRQMLDVHHVEFLSRGARVTRSTDLLILCPLCHRRQHVLDATFSAATRDGTARAAADRVVEGELRQ